MESQVYGTPVLGANIGGIPELIQVGKTGELFESGNVEELTNKICAMYKTSYDYEECSGNNFDTVEQYVHKLEMYYQTT
jgi:glycosyltransferase involved in cell wall biosynthesis